MPQNTKNVPKKIKMMVKSRQQYKCACCGVTYPAYVLDVHHIKRRSDGGSNQPSNLVAVCANCHRIIHHFDK